MFSIPGSHGSHGFSLGLFQEVLAMKDDFPVRPLILYAYPAEAATSDCACAGSSLVPPLAIDFSSDLFPIYGHNVTIQAG